MPFASILTSANAIVQAPVPERLRLTSPGGAPLVKCQLLASRFYEALRRELRKMPQLGDGERKALVAAANHCERVTSAGDLDESQTRYCCASERSVRSVAITDKSATSSAAHRRRAFDGLAQPVCRVFFFFERSNWLPRALTLPACGFACPTACLNAPSKRVH
jgi:hypothetical protein